MSGRKTRLCIGVAGAFSLGLACVGGAALADAQRTSHARPAWTTVKPVGRFEGKRNKPARDVSGIACLPIVSDERVCLVVNDESAFAQFATLRDRSLTAGATIDFIANLGARIATDPAPAGVFGSEAAGRPVAVGRCPDRDLAKDFDEFDGESVAWAPAASGGGAFYVVGSHACGRGSGTRRRSTFLLARIAADRSGRPTGPASLSWRLGEALLHADQVSAHYGLPTDRAHQGLDIEGVAAAGENLFFGLRAPSLDGQAFILRARAADLFAAGGQSAPPVQVARLPLGRDTGIRDLAALPDGRLLILSGPSQDQADVPQRLMLVTPGEQRDWPVQEALAAIEPSHAEAKAEAVTVLEATRDSLTVLVIFEDILKHHPREYVLALPR